MATQSIEAPEAQIDGLEGQLLISLSRTGGGPFQRAVVLICSHGRDGAMGLIVNAKCREPQFTDLLDLFEIDADIDASEIPIYFGGPMDTGRGFVIHSVDYSGDGTADITNEIRVSVARSILNEIAADRGPKQFLCALGYAGWAPGQLERELQQNQWIWGIATPEIVFADDRTDKWNLAVQEQGFDPQLLTIEGGQA